MKIGEYLRRENISVALCASEIGVTFQAGYRYARGERLPEPNVMRRIYVWSRGAVQPNDFYDLPPLPEGEEATGAQDAA